MSLQYSHQVGKLQIKYETKKLCNTATINSLPDEIVIKIIDYIPQNYRYYLSQTSQRFHRLSFDELCWNIVKLTARGLQTSKDERSELIRMLQSERVEHLKLIGLDDDMLLDLCQNKVHPRVKTFDIERTNIVNADLSTIGFQKWLDLATIQNSLQRLIVKNFGQMRDWLFVSLAGARSLSVLDLTGCSGYSDEGIRNLTNSALPLKFISFSAYSVSLKAIYGLIESIDSTLESIRIVHLNSAPSCYEWERQSEFLSCFEYCSKLKHLSLSPGLHFSHNNIADLFQFGRFSLERLYLKDFVNFGPDGCVALCKSKSAGTLRYMALEFCRNVGTDGFSNIISKCVMLEELSLVGVDTDARAFNPVFQSNSIRSRLSGTLRVLNIQQNRRFCDTDLHSLSKALPKTTIIFGIHDMLRNDTNCKFCTTCNRSGNYNFNYKSSTGCNKNHDWMPCEDRFIRGIVYNPCDTPVWDRPCTKSNGSTPTSNITPRTAANNQLTAKEIKPADYWDPISYDGLWPNPQQPPYEIYQPPDPGPSNNDDEDNWFSTPASAQLFTGPSANAYFDQRRKEANRQKYAKYLQLKAEGKITYKPGNQNYKKNKRY